MKIKKLFAFITSACLSISAFAVSSAIFASKTEVTVYAASIAELQQKFPAGYYWNHAGSSSNNPDGYTSTPCTHHGNCSKNGTDYSGWCGCNSCGGAIQCFGFAQKLAYDCFGSYYTTWSTTSLSNLKAGDVIRYKNDGHSIFVTAVNGDTFTYADCNSDGHCIIRWGVTMSKSDVWGLTAVYSAPGSPDPDPHIDLTVDSSFPSNITAYTIGTGDQAVYSYPGGSAESGRYITGSTDDCIIKQVYTNGWCLVNYPAKGTRRDTYTPLSYFINSGVSHTSGSGYAGTAYRRSDMSESIGTVYSTDTYTVVGSSGGKSQIIYPLDGGGYKMGWVTLAAPQPIDDSWAPPIKGFALDTGHLSVYSSPGGAVESGRYIDGAADECIIKQVYTNGWCLVSYPASGVYRDTYAPFSYFVNSGVHHYTGSGKDIITYRRPDLSEQYGEIFTYDTFTVVGQTGDSVQVLYPLDAQYGGGYKIGWVSKSSLDSEKPKVTNVKIAAYDNSSFTVTASATDNQKIQKVQAAVWTESNGQDDLIWYDMTNTSGSSYTKKVEISKHGNQTGNYIIHVYAWDVAGNSEAVGITHNFQIKYTISYNANGGEGAPDSQTKIKGTALTLSSTKPTRENYSFVGWSTNSSASVAEYNAGANFTTEANTTLYAVWEWNTYNIKYEVTGGENAPETQVKKKGSSITISNERPTKDGYTFLGWSLNEDGNVDYNPGDSYSDDTDLILYAVWQENQQTPTYTLGDINDDGDIDFQDAIFALQAEVQKRTLTDTQKLAADVNKDGEIDFQDAVKILLYDAKKITSF